MLNIDLMTTLKFINPIEVNLNELIVLEQNHLNISILEKVSDVTRYFQKILRSKPESMAKILKVYHQFLTFKEALENHFRKEKMMLFSLNEAAPEKESTGGTNLNTDMPAFLQLPLKQLKEELSSIVEILSNIQNTFGDLKSSSEALSNFFKELENLTLYLNVHRNLLKYRFYQKIMQGEKGGEFHLKAS
jgi:iron-sulfur cluster repair protein YtfE (RIC family)